MAEEEKKQKRKKLTLEDKKQKIREEQELNMQKAEAKMASSSRWMDLCRARSISVGTAFGGLTELTIRDHKGEFVFAILQPVEVIELLHTLASNVGCSVEVRPRVDFASWRSWHVTAQERLHYGNFAPPPNDMAPFNNLGSFGDSGIENSQYNNIGALREVEAGKDFTLLNKKGMPDINLIENEKNPSVLDFMAQLQREEVLNEDSMAAKKVID